jgi:hypothetical protein
MNSDPPAINLAESEQMDNIIKNITHPMLGALGSIKINARRPLLQMQRERESECNFSAAGRFRSADAGANK